MLVAMLPATKYADFGGARVAYQVFGEGPPTVVASAGSFSNTDVLWEDPTAAQFLARFGTFAEMVRYDKLGTSNSDPYPPDRLPSLDDDVAELSAVLAAVGAGEVVLWSWLDAGPIAIRFAALHPERVTKLVLYNSTARFRRADDYPIGIPDDVIDVLLAMIGATWGTEAQVSMNVPSKVGDEAFSEWYSKYVRSIGTPTTMTQALGRLLSMDVRADLASVRAPVLVIHRERYPLIPSAHGRYLAEHLPNATYVEVSGADGPAFWETPDEILEHIRDFLAIDDAPSRLPASGIATVMFTDIVDSTRRAGALGDREWGAVLAVHDETTHKIVRRFGGRVVKSTGDGVLATFPDPGSALDCARDLNRQLMGMGIAIRTGIHTGQVDTSGGDVGGLAVHIAARVTDHATGGSIVVSRTVHDLLMGSGHRFEGLGMFSLKGVDGDWDLYRSI